MQPGKNVRYATHIDITLTNAKLKKRIGNWEAKFKIANTDHAVCSIEAFLDKGPLVKRIKKTNVKAFKEKLSRLDWSEPTKWTPDTVDNEAESLTSLIKNTWEQFKVW